MDEKQGSTIPLGKETTYVSDYNPGLLFPIPRQEARNALALIDNQLPFTGKDYWTAYEISWLNNKGKPVVAMAEFTLDCSSPFIVESKSFKLYLNSFNQTRFDNIEAVAACLEKDLSTVTGCELEVAVFVLDEQERFLIDALPGDCIDHLDVEIQQYQPQAQLLQTESKRVEQEVVYSHLLKTNCPVTAQPDWATVFIEYSGQHINPESLLAYIISFREHQDFHENCVERIFCDINRYCKPDSLSVYARYTRRGGLDINPLRSSIEKKEGQLDTLRLRTSRQ